MTNNNNNGLVDRTFTIHVNSRATSDHVQNSASRFTVNLPSVLNLNYGQWRLGLRHFIYPRHFKILSSWKLDMIIEFLDEDNVEEEEEETEKKAPIIISPPDAIERAEDIIEHVKMRLSPWAEVDTLPTGNLVFDFRQRLKLHLGVHLAFILGFLNTNPSIQTVIILADSSPLQASTAEPHCVLLEAKINKKKKPHMYQFMFNQPPQHIQLFPTSMFVYCRQVDYSILGQRRLPLLAIVTLPQGGHIEEEDRSSPYQDKQFNDVNFVPLTNTQIKSLDFEIRSGHEDSLIQFGGENALTYLSLTFQRLAPP